MGNGQMYNGQMYNGKFFSFREDIMLAPGEMGGFGDGNTNIPLPQNEMGTFSLYYFY
jgi:hypothetical protein